MRESELREKIRKIANLFERPGSEGERQAAEAALKRMKDKLAQAHRMDQEIEMQFSLGNDWSRRLFVALCRRYSLNPYRYRRQRYTTVMLRAPESFLNETLWPEFLELDKTLIAYLNSITDRIIAEEIHGVVAEADEVSEPLELPG
ncbi:MAG: hypothetical protein C4527_01410 [Candidatus Omnitrophota bacterium]|nr:MAG: hypothetical protein C4527_01410 [Candidatus Omnitrophota bacterium]